MDVHVYTHRGSFPPLPAETPPPAAHGAVSPGTHRGHAWHVLGTHRGHVGDVPLCRAAFRDTQTHAGGDPPSPSFLQASGCPWSWCPGHTGVALGKPLRSSGCAMGHIKPCQQLCSPVCSHVWLLFSHGAAVVVLLCDCAHPHMWLLSPTGVVVLVPLRGCAHTCVSLYMSVAILMHTERHGCTRVWPGSHTCMITFTHMAVLIFITAAVHACGCAHTRT